MINLHICKSKEINEQISIIKVKNWLKEYQYVFFQSIQKTSCRKWSKWLNDNSIHLYPCVCPVRNEDCIFVETYFELSKVIEISKMEERCEIELTKYQQIQHNKSAIFEWIKANEGLLEKIIYFSTIIKINSNKEENINVKLNPVHFKNILHLQSIFQTHYYSEQYKNY